MARKWLTPAQLQVVQAVRSALAHHLPGVGRVRVGFSGGADSSALLAATCHLAGDGLHVEAMVVDHGLQPGSDQVAAQAAGRARALGAEATVVRVQVHPGGEGIEAAARTARRAALLAGGVPVLLGHTLDDQAEGVLLGLARGSGPVSLRGMAARSEVPGCGQLVRPLLEVRRRTTHRACRDWGLEVWDDPMNEDPVFRRVRVRQAISQLDEVLGPGLPEALARTARLLRDDNDLLDVMATEALRECERGLALDCVFLVHLHPSLRGRVVRHWLVARGASQPTLAHVQAVLALVLDWHGQRGVDLPGGVQARREAGLLVVGPRRRG